MVSQCVDFYILILRLQRACLLGVTGKGLTGGEDFAWRYNWTPFYNHKPGFLFQVVIVQKRQTLQRYVYLRISVPFEKRPLTTRPKNAEKRPFAAR